MEQKIALTAPVLEAAAGDRSTGPGQQIALPAPTAPGLAGDRWRLAFVLPSSITRATAPAPTNPRVRIQGQPRR